MTILQRVAVRARSGLFVLLAGGGLAGLASADLQRVNVGVYGGTVRDITAFDHGGTSRVLLALEGNRGVFEWSATATNWTSTTYPLFPGKATMIEANRKAGYADDVYAMMFDPFNVPMFVASDAGGALGTWTNVVVDWREPNLLCGHATGMYAGTRNGQLYLNAGGIFDPFALVYALPVSNSITSISVYDGDLIYVVVEPEATPSNVFKLTRSGGVFTHSLVPLPATTASTSPVVRITQVGVDPGDPNELFIGGSTFDNHMVFMSTNAGADWDYKWDKHVDRSSPWYFEGALVAYVKFSQDRAFISSCVLPEGTHDWRAPDQLVSRVGTGSGTSTVVNTHVNDGTLEIDPLDPTIVYLGTDWAIGALPCTLGGTWGIGTEMGNNDGIAGVVLNDMDYYAYNATNKELWIAAKSGIGKVLQFNPQDPASSATPQDWVFPLYPDGCAAFSVAIDPYNPDQVLAGYGSGRVFMITNGTQDAGIAWKQVFFAGDHPEVFDTTGSDSIITDIGFVPGTSNAVYLGGWRSTPPLTNGGVFFSQDGGLSWTNVARGFPVNALFVSDIAVWAGVGNDESPARGLRVRQSPTHWWAPLTGLRVDTQVVHAIAAAQVGTHMTAYLAAKGGVYKGVIDLANTSCTGFACWAWTDLTLGIPTYKTDFLAVTVDPTNASLAYVSADNCIFRTTDAGSTWTTLSGTCNISHEDVKVLKFDDLMAGTATGLYAIRDVIAERKKALPFLLLLQ